MLASDSSSGENKPLQVYVGAVPDLPEYDPYFLDRGFTGKKEVISIAHSFYMQNKHDL